MNELIFSSCFMVIPTAPAAFFFKVVHQLQVFTSQFVLFPLCAHLLFSHLLPSLAFPRLGAQEMPVSG